MAKNENLHKAKAAKNDEFYTQATDIEKEMVHYRDHFRGKTIFCNCDDPTWSEFWKYFHLNFEFLGLKKLISTHYDAHEPTYKMEYEGGNDTDTEAGVKTRLMQNGDFRSKECLAILDHPDVIVCTNPPFSMFREYIDTLEKHNAEFIVLGNMNAATYKEIFALIKQGKLWYGASIHSGDREFRVPDSYPLTASGCRIDEKGNKFVRVKGIRWFTNIDYKARHENLILWRHYTPGAYPKYDNYNAINVDKYGDIPCDYDGVMGCPITILDHLNPDQFEIIGQSNKGDTSPETEALRTDPKHKHGGLINGKEKYMRIFIRRKVA